MAMMVIEATGSGQSQGSPLLVGAYHSQAEWIWDAERPFGAACHFRRSFTVSGPVKRAVLQIACDDIGEVFLNGESVHHCGFTWGTISAVDLTDRIKPGRNVLAVEDQSLVDPAGILGELTVVYADGAVETIPTDASWKCHKAPPEGDWKAVDYDDSAWPASSSMGPPPVGPWGAITFVDESEREQLRLVSARIPLKADAGSSITVSIKAQPTGALNRDYLAYVRLVKDGWTLVERDFAPAKRSSAWPADQATTLGPVRISVPQFAPSGRYQVQMGLYRTEYAGAKQAVGEISIRGRESKVRPPRCEVKPLHGGPAVFINGKPVFPMVYSEVPEPSARHTRQFGQAGIHLYELIGMSGGDAGDLGWVAPGKFDYRGLDRRALTILSADPQAYFFPRVYVEPPSWWVDQHPDDIIRLADGTGWISDAFGSTKAVSFASQAWLREAGEAFARYIDHIQASPYADRVIGYHIGAGIYGEWHWKGSEHLPDLSPAMTNRFRAFLRARYRTVEALRKAWNDPAVTFDSAEVPGMEARLSTDVGMFRDPAKSLRVTDYYECHHRASEDAALHFCHVAKQQSSGRSLTGIFFGYTSNVLWIQEGGHLEVSRILRSLDVDFLCSPHTYVGRAMGDDGGLRALPGSWALHGKYFMDESDDRTHRVPPSQVARLATTMSDSIAVLRREFVNVLTQNSGQWWFDQDCQWFDDPVLMRELSAMTRAGQRSLALPRQRVSQVAVLVDLKSVYYTANWRADRDPVTPLLLNDQWRALYRMGTPFDLYQVSDLRDPRMPEYRCYIFLNAFYLTKEDREAIARRVKRDGKVAVWLYAPGIISESGLDVAQVSELIGMAARMEDKAAPTRGRLSLETETPVAQRLSWGSDTPVSPRVWVEDQDTLVMGEAADGRPAMAVRQTDQWTSIWLSGPVAPPELLRAITQSAGAHIYLDSGDPFYANASFLAIHTSRAGKKLFRLPAKCDVYDAITTRCLARGVSEFEVDLPEHATGIYEVIGCR